uniref:(northern house mosquito) hypothetical protein n=1 Tax=Culex pipiens TaxID=7175 RepID=A0A8D8JBG7_CULPI
MFSQRSCSNLVSYGLFNVTNAIPAFNFSDLSTFQLHSGTSMPAEANVAGVITDPVACGSSRTPRVPCKTIRSSFKCAAISRVSSSTRFQLPSLTSFHCGTAFS